jgi:pimeloyl-ACP methyl ester carboxylesterase
MSECNPQRDKGSSDAVRRWVVFISGFLQREGSATPFEKLHRRISKRIADPDTIVLLRSWRDSVDDLAQRIANWRNGCDPHITIVGYSYGGWSANKLARALQGFDMQVDAMILCDPVGRWLGSWPSICSMLNVLPVVVPANVRNLWSFRQTRQRPYGARIALQREAQAIGFGRINAGTLWRGQTVLAEVPHVNMDDLPKFQETVYLAVGNNSEQKS